MAANRFGEGAVVEIYSNTEARWLVALVVAPAAGADAAAAVNVRFLDSTSRIREKVFPPGHPQLAAFGAHFVEETKRRGGDALPPGFEAVASQSRPGQVSYLQASKQQKFAHLEMAWKVYLDEQLGKSQKPAAAAAAAGAQAAQAAPPQGAPARAAPAYQAAAPAQEATPYPASASAAPKESTRPSRFSPGDRVKIIGLLPEYDGSECIVVSQEGTSVRVQLSQTAAQTEVMDLEAVYLKLLEAAPPHAQAPLAGVPSPCRAAEAVAGQDDREVVPLADVLAKLSAVGQGGGYGQSPATPSASSHAARQSGAARAANLQTGDQVRIRRSLSMHAGKVATVDGVDDDGSNIRIKMDEGNMLLLNPLHLELLDGTPAASAAQGFSGGFRLSGSGMSAEGASALKQGDFVEVQPSCQPHVGKRGTVESSPDASGHVILKLEEHGNTQRLSLNGMHLKIL
eukprot:TRINITY_DN121377_c0_g1_i1.p1 TRINITY_DN121377_c0_g1~~TRINITY_DN121377_c0_g1_i1.p1  ORF type:complete len:493 (+),score=123.99 TRINITY_DN121377_c0_g1_i1:112-1479(+)